MDHKLSWTRTLIKIGEKLLRNKNPWFRAKLQPIQKPHTVLNINTEVKKNNEVIVMEGGREVVQKIF